MAPPNAFSNELARWVANKCTQSIVFVEIRPKNPNDVKVLWDFIDPIREEPQGFGPENASRLVKCRDTQCCTGFVVDNDDDGHIMILTCAHVLGHVFNRQKPVTPTQLNDMYDTLILCDHEEEAYQSELVENEDVERKYMSARVVRIDCSMDLMLLRVSKREVRRRCSKPHPAIRMAKSLPNQLMKVVMLSWPVQSHRTAVEGKISHPSRPLSFLSNTNICDFEMKLSQVDITSEVGSSGAPLLNGYGNYCGVLFGGNGSFSFYVSYEDLKNTMTSWGLDW